MANMQSLIRMRDNLERQLLQLSARIEQAESLPAEPTNPNGPDEPCVIWFVKQFSTNGTPYTYAAVRTGGLWYTTGPRSPKSYTWDELVAWMLDGPVPTEIWYATEWEPC